MRSEHQTGNTKNTSLRPAKWLEAGHLSFRFFVVAFLLEGGGPKSGAQFFFQSIPRSSIISRVSERNFCAFVRVWRVSIFGFFPSQRMQGSGVGDDGRNEALKCCVTSNCRGQHQLINGKSTYPSSFRLQDNLGTLTRSDLKVFVFYFLSLSLSLCPLFPPHPSSRPKLVWPNTSPRITSFHSPPSPSHSDLFWIDTAEYRLIWCSSAATKSEPHGIRRVLNT